MQAPRTIEQYLPGHAGRGREGNKPQIIVIHTQAGSGNPWNWFKSLGTSGANAADCTVWNSKEGVLYRYLYDTDTAWTNGSWTEPITHSNPVLNDLWKQGIYSGDVSLTVENEGYQSLTSAQLESLAQLCAWWSVTYNIPADANHIVKHSDIGPHKQCPGFDLTPLIKRTQEILGGNKPVNNPQTFTVNFTGTPQQIFVDEPFYTYWKNHGGIEVFGYPMNGEEAASKYGLTDCSTVQIFERAVFQSYDDKPGNVGLMRLGAFWKQTQIK